MSEHNNYKKYQRGSAASQICDELRKEILTLELKPGSPLDETGLSKRFNVSRSPIREALNRLLVERLVETLPNRSTVVAPVDIENFPNFIEALDLQQRYATRLAARTRTSADLLKLSSLADDFDQAVKNFDHFEIMQSNFEFHVAVAKAGRNPYVVRQYSELLSEARRLLHIHVQFLETVDAKEVLEGHHQDIFDAIEARDVSAADLTAHQHTMTFQDRFLRALRNTPDIDFAIEVPAGKSKNRPAGVIE